MISAQQNPGAGFAEFFQEALPKICLDHPSSSKGSGYALPEATLDCIRTIVRYLKIGKVFEFGSGRSTKMFLDAGCFVTSLENDQAWQNETLRTLTNEERQRLHINCQPLDRLFHHGSPFRGWRLHPDWAGNLETAELILIDSPAFPPFREYALLTTLSLNSKSLVIVDDAAIPTVHRFCSRIAQNNPPWLHFYSERDHGLFFFAPVSGKTLPLKFGRGFWESVKAWRRYLIASRSAKVA